MPTSATIPVRLFYSYSHNDGHFQESMEKALALLRAGNLLQEWSDRKNPSRP